MELTNEEISKVFSMYGLKQECRTAKGVGNPNQVLFVKSLYTTEIVVTSSDNLSSFHGGYLCRYDQILLALTPLSKISDEDAIEVAVFIGGNSDQKERAELIRIGRSMVGLGVMNIGYLIAPVYDYLILKGYATKLYCFPINHPAYGKTAIELNIAKEHDSKPS